MTLTIEERFYRHVDKTPACWLWTAHLNPNGYAQMLVGGKLVYVHRLSVMLDGRDIPASMEVDHLCRVRHCVNPTHLEVVTRRENMLRSTSPMAAQARQTHCKLGHPLSGDNLRLRPRRNGFLRCCRACDRRYCREYYAKRKAMGFCGRHLKDRRDSVNLPTCQATPTHTEAPGIEIRSAP